MKSFDLQVNGSYGVDFNSQTVTLEEVRGACRRLKEDGVTGFLVTFITDELEVLEGHIRRFVAFREEDPLVRELIAGIHVEGPFLNPKVGFRGAHPKDAMCPAKVDKVKPLLEAGGGLIKLVTLAPERDRGGRTTAFLAEQGIVVSAGHCDPSLDQLREGVDSGLSMATHVGNGCPAQLQRHDNVVQRFLYLAEHLWCCFIADGVHIPSFALQNYLKVAGLDRSIVVTDAISAAGLGPGRYRIAAWELEIGEDLVARPPKGDHLVGSTATMPRTEAVLRDQCGLNEAEIGQLIYHNPRKALEG